MFPRSFRQAVSRVAAHTSLRTQVMFVVLLTLAAALAVSYSINASVESRALDEVRAYVESTSRAVQISVNHFRDLRAGVEVLSLEAEAVPVGIRRLILRDTRGEVITETPPGEGRPEADSADAVSYRIPVVDGDRLVGYLDVEVTTTGLRDIFRNMIISKIWLWGLVFLMGALVLVPVAHAVSQSQRQVASVAAAVAAGDLEPPFPAPLSLEAERLFSSFRSLLARLRLQRETESELRRAERAAAIGRMTAGVAHDIRNPLNYVELALGELWRDRQRIGPPEPGQQALYDGIRQELSKVRDITGDLLVYGKPAIPQIESLSAASLLENCRTDLSRRRPDRHQDVQIESPTDDLRFLADPDLVRRALTNVINNALDATEAGDPVRVGCASPQDGQVILFVEDSGPGIPAEIRDQVFEPYVTGKPSGTGLGLALARQWIRDMNGKILVGTDNPAGTRVEIWLPQARGES